MLRKWLAMLLLTIFVCTGVFTCQVWAEQQSVSDKLIRLHVVANSDSAEDQNRKLLVRDAVLLSVTELTKDCADAQTAQRALAGNLEALQQTAQDTLRQAGDSSPVSVSLQTEWFDSRRYDTFSLPAGRYVTLRLVLGEGAGHNWWCVAFPALCLPATAEGFEAAAAASGMTDTQTDLLTGEGTTVKIKFRTLEWLDALLSWLRGG